MRFIRLLTMLAAASMTLAAAEWTGYVSDTKCAASNAKAKSAAEWVKPEAFEACAKQCVKAGSEPVFVTEDNKILKFDADSAKKIMPHLGHKVTVTGTVEGDILTVRSIQ
jgi:hypothetical protein